MVSAQGLGRDFIRYSCGPYLHGESECRNADCGRDVFNVLLVAGISGGQGAWGTYDELRCPSCGARTRALRKKRGARPRKSFPAGFANAA